MNYGKWYAQEMDRLGDEIEDQENHRKDREETDMSKAKELTEKFNKVDEKDLKSEDLKEFADAISETIGKVQNFVDGYQRVRKRLNKDMQKAKDNVDNLGSGESDESVQEELHVLADMMQDFLESMEELANDNKKEMENAVKKLK